MVLPSIYSSQLITPVPESCYYRDLFQSLDEINVIQLQTSVFQPKTRRGPRKYIFYREPLVTIVGLYFEIKQMYSIG